MITECLVSNLSLEISDLTHNLLTLKSKKIFIIESHEVNYAMADTTENTIIEDLLFYYTAQSSFKRPLQLLQFFYV